MAGAPWTSYDASFPARWMEAVKKPSRAGGKPAKARPRRVLKRKGRSAPKPMIKRRPVADDRATEIAQLRRELTKSREQQAATSEVLQVISSSSGELDRVFQAMLANACRLCKADLGTLSLYENGAFRAATASHNVPPAYAERRQREPVIHPGPHSPLARVTKSKRLLHISDCAQDIGYKQRDPSSVVLVELAEVRTLLNVPLLKAEQLIGVFGIYRHQVLPFTNKEIELVANFAAQAVIAIENARLLNELRESLQEQTATSEVLQVISSSPGDLEPVFSTYWRRPFASATLNSACFIVMKSGRLCLVAAREVPPMFAAAQEGPFTPAPGGMLDSVMKKAGRFTYPTSQLTSLPRTASNNGGGSRTWGRRTVVAVPMLKENELVGLIGIYRQEVRPFTDKQIALVTNFAAQAVIAIENARLLNELRRVPSGADGHVGGAPGHQQLSRRSAAGVCGHAGESRPHLRRQFWQYLSLGWRALHLLATHNTPRCFAEHVNAHRFARQDILSSAWWQREKRRAPQPICSR